MTDVMATINAFSGSKSPIFAGKRTQLVIMVRILKVWSRDTVAPAQKWTSSALQGTSEKEVGLDACLITPIFLEQNASFLKRREKMSSVMKRGFMKYLRDIERYQVIFVLEGKM
jgi:hypothetical protein